MSRSRLCTALVLFIVLGASRVDAAQPRKPVADSPVLSVDSSQAKKYGGAGFTIVEFDFEGSGGPDPQGWTSSDRRSPDEAYFRIEDFAGLPAPYGPLAGSQSLWCGSRGETWCPGSTAPGYGDFWDQRFVSREFSTTGNVFWAFDMRFDLEADYDSVQFQYLDATGSWVSVVDLGGSSGDSPTNFSGLIPGVQLGSTTRFRFRVQSDQSWSDQSGLYDSNGAIVVDGIILSDAAGILDSEDFESGSVGDSATADGDWSWEAPVGMGDLSLLQHGSTVAQPGSGGSPNLSHFWTFYEGSPDTVGSCGSDPSAPSIPLPRVTSDGLQRFENHILSPPIDLTSNSAGVPAPPGLVPSAYRLEFDVYRNLPLDSGVFFAWSVRNSAPCDQVWQGIPAVYYGSVAEWQRVSFDITSLIDPDEPIEVRLSILDHPIIPTPAECHTQGAFFDNVAIVADYNSLEVTNTDAVGPGSLTQAILDANLAPGPNHIEFNIPGSGPHVIDVPLGVSITSRVFLDGFTQPGSTPNTNPVGEPSNADLRVVINTWDTSTYVAASAASTWMRGLVFQAGTQASNGNMLVAGDYTTISGCYLGTDPTGLTPSVPGTPYGLVTGAYLVRVGGPDPVDRCVISGNSVGGVLVSGDHQTQITGCYIGTDATGAAPLPNGTGPLPDGYGILVGSTFLTSATEVTDCIVAYNEGPGVWGPGYGSPVLHRNSIFENSGLGIDLETTGPTSHPAAPTPVITSVDPATGTITGNFTSTPVYWDFELEFFSSPTCDPSGYGEGMQFLGSLTLTSGPPGPTTPFTAVLGPLGDVGLVTATLTRPNFLTSEFSECYEIAVPTGVTTAAATGPGSLHQALQDAAATPGPTTISFNLPGPGPHLIDVPPLGLVIDSEVILDGFTQPGSSPNTNAKAEGSNANLQIVINTPSAPIQITGTGGQTILRGLVILSDQQAAIQTSANNVTITGCYLGTDATGLAPGAGSPQRGVLSSGTGLLIGGPDPADRCVISANALAGIEITGGNASIQGCFIGIDAAGADGLGNGGLGGIVTTATGLPLLVRDSVIAFNTGAGIRAVGDAHVMLVSNTIFSNGGLGVDTTAAGLSSDPDSPTPTILSVDTGTGIITGTVDSPNPETKARIEFFSNPACDPSGSGEGKTPLGAIEISIPTVGVTPFNANLGPIPEAVNVVANFTTHESISSEFSTCFAAPTAVQPATPQSTRLTLEQNLPNPFNPSTTIQFNLPSEGPVQVDVFDVGGRRIAVLLDEVRPAGPGSVRWNGVDGRGARAASGVYYYRLSAGSERIVRRMVLLK